MEPQPAEGQPASNRIPASSATTTPSAPGDDRDARRHLAIHEHELLRRIGRGAYGEVWLARNTLGAGRAVKVVYRKDFEDSRPFEREFRGIQKFEPISRSHEGLVNILQVGRHDDYFYYVMELADDAAKTPKSEIRSPNEAQNPNTEPAASPELVRNFGFRIPSDFELRNSDFYTPLTLREELRTHGRLPAERCVEIGLALTSALAHLHKHGLVHRDIKPSNIILVNGKPKLADIGLVTEAGDSKSIVGTEGYLPPEGPGAPQADIFSLGKVLYEIGTGQDRRQFPDLPPNLKDWPDCGAVLELNEIVLKACAYDRKRRYSGTEPLSRNLELLQRGRSVKARHRFQKSAHSARKILVRASVMALVAAAAALLWRTMERPFQALSTGIGAGALSGTSNAEANRAYTSGLRAISIGWGTPAGFRQAKESFTEATNADPQFVAAHARLFETYLMGEDYDLHTSPKAKANLLSGLSVDLLRLAPTNAETYAAFAIVHFLNDWKWVEAEREFKQALTQDANCKMALTYCGYMLTRQLRTSEAREKLERALKIDGESPLITKFLGHCEFAQRHYASALRFYWHASELERTYPGGHYWAGRVSLAMGNFAQALDEFEDHARKQGLPPSSSSREERAAFERDGIRGYWRKCLDSFQDDPKRFPYWYAECHARLGEKSQALAGLEEAVKQRDTVENLLVDEFWDNYRDEPRFRQALKIVGLDRWAPIANKRP